MTDVSFLPGTIAPAEVRYLPLLHRLPGVKWMASRLAALPVLAQALRQHHGDPAACTAFVWPVLFTFGSLTNPRWRVMRDRLQNYFPAFTSQEFEGLHRRNTSHQAEPDRTATLLMNFWRTSTSPDSAGARTSERVGHALGGGV